MKITVMIRDRAGRLLGMVRSTTMKEWHRLATRLPHLRVSFVTRGQLDEATQYK